MPIKMLLFDFKRAELNFFKKNKLDKFDIQFFDESLNETTVKNLPEDMRNKTEVISISRTSSINDCVLKNFPNLKILSTRSAGYDHINIEACNRNEIKVINIKNYGSKSVAQYTFGLILNLLRKIIVAQKDMQAFKFEYPNYVGTEVNGLTLGIFGTGAIGAEVSRIAHAFDMKILAFDKNINQEIIDKYEVEYSDKETILKTADIISLHLPLNNETKNFITKKELAITKATAFLINTSRGELVNTEDLYDSITTGNLAGAGLDVVECEPIAFLNKNITQKLKNINPDCFEKIILARRLSQLDNVIVTPHIAYSTTKSIDRILKITFDSISACTQGEHTNQIN